jgi:antitoxin (DNA-binding transcriptional repressor) of toxin-antitoxin stability system
MKTMSLTDAQTQLAQLVDVLKEGPVLLLRKGQPCAALVGLDEHFDREAFSLGRDKSLRRLIDEACRKTKEGGGIPFSEILQEVDAQLPSRKKRPGRPRAKGPATR